MDQEEKSANPGEETTTSSSERSRKVWVVHGRDRKLKEGMFNFLRAIGLEPLEFDAAVHRAGAGAPPIGAVLETAFKDAQAVVVLLTPDDETRLRPDLLGPGDPPYEKTLTGQPRPNVLFEAGMAFATHRAETILVQIGKVRPFSDIAGLHIVVMDSPAKRKDLAERLQQAQCPVNRGGGQWLEEDYFRTHKPPRRIVLTAWSLSALIAVTILAVAVSLVKRLRPDGAQSSPSHPEVSISDLPDEVGDTVTITGKARGVPADEKIWLVVKSTDGRFYSQSDPPEVSIPDKSGRLSWTYDNTCVGPRMDWGQQFEIEAVLASQDAQEELKRAAAGSPCQSPIFQLPDGATVYASKKVTRKQSP